MAGDHLLQSAKTVGPAVAGPLSGRRRADHHKLSGTKRDGSDWHAKDSAGAKLAVGGVADRFEQEANRAADKVLDSRPLTMNSDFDKGVDKQSPSASHSHLAFEAPPTIGAALAGNSHSFDATTLSFMEQRFDHDFSRVRVHTDAVAARAAADVNACAFTCKNHIVFGAEQFAPGTRKGRHLIAHELAHIVQQKQGSSPLFQREVNTNQEAAGGDSVWDRAFLLADQSRWEEVAELINSFNAENLRYFIQTYKAQPDKLSLLYLGAIGNKKVGPDSQLAKMTRVAYLDFNFNEESRKGNWPRAAFFINAFNPDDVKQRLKKLDTGKLKALHEGAVANAELGVNSGAAKISAEVLAGRSAQGDTKALILPTIKSDSKEGLVQVMQVIDSIQPSPVTSDVFTITVDGQPQTLNAAQAQDIRRKAGAVLKDHLKRVQDKAATAADRYKGQNEVDKQHWVIAPIVKTFGRVKDPGPELLAYAASADASVKAAYRAVDAGSLAQAATLLATGEASAISAMKMWQAYFEGIIGAGEMTITVLEITRDASFITLAILATIATGGAAAGALGAEGAAATTTVFGVELGVSGATAANVIVTGAPIVANLSEAVAKVSMGDKVDWGALAIDTAIQIVIARFGGRVTGGIAKALLGNPATKTLASRVTEKVVHAAIMHIGSTVLMTAAQDAYKRLKGQEITWQAFIDELIDRLIDPKGLAVIAVTGVVSSAAEAKYGGSGGKTSTSGQSTAGEAEPSKAAQPKAEAPKIETPKIETPKVEAPKAEAPKVEAPKAEAPKAEAPKAEAPKIETPKVEAPKGETPKVEAPKIETPKVEAPKVEAPKVEAPKIETPKVETPKAETPKAETPKAEAPKVEAPKVEAPKAQALEAEVPKIDAPEAVAQKGVPAEVDAAEGYLPKAEAPRAEAAEMKGKVPASGSKAKPFDIRQLGTEAEPPQTLDPADFTKIKLKPGQEAVYILRDADGTVLKVGKTSASAAKNRFSTYKRAGKLTGKALQLEVHPLKPGEHKAQYFEDALRSKMEAEGHEMPWDNTRGRLKRPGFGTPGEGIRSPPVSKEKMHELLTLHKGNLREVGKALGVHRRTADLWAKSYGLVPRDFK